jgi:prepilin-type N-terminal cleavage/methylation domain-containing protein
MKKQAGFSLVEISIVMVVMGLLMGAVLNGGSAFIQNSRISKTKKDLDTISQSITGFVVANGRFPCPDTNDDGEENCDGSEYGQLPYVDLGAEKFDFWNSPYMYAADTDYSNDPPGALGACDLTFNATSDEGDITLKEENVDRTGIAAAVYSLGPDGISQQENLPADKPNLIFLAKNFSPAFDDIFVSISSLEIKANRASQLPEDPGVCTP